MGPSGPPILPLTTFSVVPFPKLREQFKAQQSCFTFLGPSVLDEEEEKKDTVEDTPSKVMLFFYTSTRVLVFSVISIHLKTFDIQTAIFIRIAPFYNIKGSNKTASSHCEYHIFNNSETNYITSQFSLFMCFPKKGHIMVYSLSISKTFSCPDHNFGSAQDSSC